MANKVNEVTEKNVRVEVLFPESMYAWMKDGAKLKGLSMSGLIKLLVANDLTRTFGPGWSQGHPQGDQDNVVGDQGA